MSTTPLLSVDDEASSPHAPNSFLPFALPDITEAEIAAVTRVLRSGWVTSGPEMSAFERDFTEYLKGGVEAVAVNSATAGLHLALEACGVGPGDDVIVPTWTFTATAEVVRHVGARPVLVDVDPSTLHMDLAGLEQAITPSTKAVIPVHVAGLGLDTKLIRAVVGSNVRIVEDAAHALPTSTLGEQVGECHYSDAAVFSFYATKTITTGEGGMITTRDPLIASRARVMRLHGIDRDAFHRYRSRKPAWEYDVVAAGYKYNMTDPAAAMGRVQLSRSPSMHTRRQQIAEAYLEAFDGLPLQLPYRAPSHDTHAWHLFIVRLLRHAPLNRNDLISFMASHGVATSVHFTPLHLLTMWRESLDVSPEHFPNATQQFQSALSLPIYSAMSDSAVNRVIESLMKAFS